MSYQQRDDESVRPSPARMYDYMLGGTAHLQVDRDAVERIKAFAPDVEAGAWAVRGFKERVARWLAGPAGVDQVLDLGSGLPRERNVHDLVHRLQPEATVVYVDNDPAVAGPMHHLLARQERAAFIPADVRNADALLAHPALRARIDFRRPVALLFSVLQHLSDDDDPWALVARYLSATCAGSYLVAWNAWLDREPHPLYPLVHSVFNQAGFGLYPRSTTAVERFFDGLALVPPHSGAESGLFYPGQWEAEDPEAAVDDASSWLLCGVGRKP